MKNSNLFKSFILIIFSIVFILFLGLTSNSHALYIKVVNSKNSIEIKTNNHTVPISESGADKIWKLAGVHSESSCSTDEIGSTGLANDCTDDHNLRYIGKDPNNYVTFNNELWRIIGVMNDIEDGNGNIHSQLKIIKSNILSKGMDNNFNTLYKTVLDDTYFDSIDSISQKFVDLVVWYKSTSIDRSVSSSKMYNEEIKDKSLINEIKKINFMYASDFGFSTAGNTSFLRKNCLNYNLDTWGSYSGCYENSWIYDSNYWQYAMNSSAIKEYVYSFHPYDGIGTTRSIRPSLYLKPSIKITGGSGTSSDPYKLSL